MTDRYDLESTSDSYELEDGTGVLLIDQRVFVQNEIIELNESAISVFNLKFVIDEIIGLAENFNYVTGFTKIINDTVGIISDTVNLILTLINWYRLEDDTGNYDVEDAEGNGLYLLDQFQDIQFGNDTVGITETNVKFLGPIKIIAEILGITEANNRARTMLRNIGTDVVGLIDINNRLGVIKRNISETLGITESQNRLGVIIRNLADTVGITETVNKLRGRLQNISDSIGITEAQNSVTGIVKVILDTIGLTEIADRIRVIFIDFDILTMIANTSVNLSNFICNVSQDNGDLTVIDSFNAEDFNVSDTN